MFLWFALRGDTVMRIKAALKEVRTRLKRVLIYSKIGNATLLLVIMDTGCKLYFKRDNVL